MGNIIIPGVLSSWYVPGIYVNVELGKAPPSAAGQARRILLIGTADAGGESDPGELQRVVRLDILGEDDTSPSAEYLFGKNTDDPSKSSLYWMCYAAWRANPNAVLYAVAVDTGASPPVTMTDVLSSVGGPAATQRFHYVVVDGEAGTPADSAELLKDYVEELAEPLVGFRQQGILGLAGEDPTEELSPTVWVKSERLQVVWSYQKDWMDLASPVRSYDPRIHGYGPCMLAAAMASARSRAEGVDPAANLCLAPVRGIPAPRELSAATHLNDYLQAGVTPIVPYESDMVILRSISTMRVDEGDAMHETLKTTVTDLVADDLVLKMASRYRGFKLAPDTDLPPPSRTATPLTVRQAIIEWLRAHEKAGRITLVTELSERIRVELDSEVPGRLNFEIPEDVIDSFAVGAGNIIQIG